MKTVLAPRASAIIYDVLVSRASRGTFLLPANVCPIVPLTFLKAAVPYEFVDISADTLHMDLEQVQARLSDGKRPVGGLLYVHTYGDPSTPREDFAAIKRDHPELLVIDDRCLCIPELEADPSNAADVQLYSTGYAKIVDLNLGGFAFVKENLAYEHRSLPFQEHDLEAIEDDYKRSLADRSQYSYEDLDWLQTDAEMPAWSRYSERVNNLLKLTLLQRRSINAVYDSFLPAELRLPDEYQTWRYNIRVPDNKKILATIFAGGLFASAHYASLQGIFGAGAEMQAAHLAQHVINLFNDHRYSLDMAEKTARLILGSL